MSDEDKEGIVEVSTGGILGVGEDGRPEGFDILAGDRVMEVDVTILAGDVFFPFDFGFGEDVGTAGGPVLFDLRGAAGRQGGEDNPIEPDGLLGLGEHRREIDLGPLPGCRFAHGSVMADGHVGEEDVPEETATARRAAPP